MEQMSAENIFGPEYMANAHRHDMTVKCLDMLRLARSVAVLPIAWHLERAIAAAEGALAGYGWRGDELYIEATKGIPPATAPIARLPPGRLRIVDRGPFTVRWADIASGERGFTARDAWDAALQAGTICVVED